MSCPLSKKGWCRRKDTERDSCLIPGDYICGQEGHKDPKEASRLWWQEAQGPSRFKVAIDMNTLTSDHPKLTNHLKSADFLIRPSIQVRAL